MPLLTPAADATASPSALAQQLQRDAAASGASSFAAVYASHVVVQDGADGGQLKRSWCGDCVAAEPMVERKFGGSSSDDGDGGKKCWVVWVGDKDEWRTPENVWRKAPFGITHLPTLVKVTPEGKWEKLVEGDVYNQKKLDAFVGF
ncbi:thioredoxin-like protein 5 [Diplodia corticola]|uniref:Thioredoxin-like protein 5 n=1 Tax=Diplodia corticola TaxID=236234 RepID=A0A1J9QYW3_9PEZI|nr:thioredoxin-like protein 5 [Diplodia corticola]OJD34262.1 thioredoxin-like protein 5 [Diplodia corticola]